MNAPATTIERILSGDRRAIARAISAVENEADESHAIRAALAAHVGRAHVVGITGPPGAGKSSLVAAMLEVLLARKRRVAVVAVDPSSPVSGGALLGDRIRMGRQQAHEDLFIRSLASRGHAGGLSRTTSVVVDVLDAAGFDIVIVETVGAGQSEVEVASLADTKLVLCPPGLGDDVQAIKAGVLEIADALIVSKADVADAERTERDLRAMLALRRDTSAPQPPVLKTAAASGDGVAALIDWLESRTPRGVRHGAAEQRSSRSLVQRLVAADAYAKHLGLELVDAGTGSATVRLRVGPQHVNFNGGCHGGAIFSLADTALGLACNSHGTIAALIDGHLSLSAGAELGDWLTARAIEVSRTRKLGVYRIEITRGPQREHVGVLSATVYLTGRPLAG